VLCAVAQSDCTMLLTSERRNEYRIVSTVESCPSVRPSIRPSVRLSVRLTGTTIRATEHWCTQWLVQTSNNSRFQSPTVSNGYEKIRMAAPIKTSITREKNNGVCNTYVRREEGEKGTTPLIIISAPTLLNPRHFPNWIDFYLVSCTRRCVPFTFGDGWAFHISPSEIELTKLTLRRAAAAVSLRGAY
jgi:hypothetical protein